MARHYENKYCPGTGSEVELSVGVEELDKHEMFALLSLDHRGGQVNLKKKKKILNDLAIYSKKMEERHLRPINNESIELIRTINHSKTMPGCYNHIFPVWPIGKGLQDVVFISKEGEKKKKYVLNQQQQIEISALLLKKLNNKGWFSYIAQKGFDKKMEKCRERLLRGKLISPYGKGESETNLNILEHMAVKRFLVLCFPCFRDVIKVLEPQGWDTIKQYQWVLGKAIIVYAVTSASHAWTQDEFSTALVGVTSSYMAYIGDQVVEKVKQKYEDWKFSKHDMLSQLIIRVKRQAKKFLGDYFGDVVDAFHIILVAAVSSIVGFVCFKLVIDKLFTPEAVTASVTLIGENASPFTLPKVERPTEYPFLFGSLLAGVSMTAILRNYRTVKIMAKDFTDLALYPFKAFVNFLCSAVGADPFFDMIDRTKECRLSLIELEAAYASGTMKLGELFCIRDKAQKIQVKYTSEDSDTHDLLASKHIRALERLDAKIRNMKRTASDSGKRVEPICIAFISRKVGIYKTSVADRKSVV